MNYQTLSWSDAILKHVVVRVGSCENVELNSKCNRELVHPRRRRHALTGEKIMSHYQAMAHRCSKSCAKGCFQPVNRG